MASGSREPGELPPSSSFSSHHPSFSHQSRLQNSDASQLPHDQERAGSAAFGMEHPQGKFTMGGVHGPSLTLSVHYPSVHLSYPIYLSILASNIIIFYRYLSIYSSVHDYLSICICHLSIQSSLHYDNSSIHLSVCLLIIYPSTNLYRLSLIHPSSIYLSICRSIYPFMCISIQLILSSTTNSSIHRTTHHSSI